MLHFLRVGICQRARHPPRAPGARWIQRPRLPRLPTAINRLRVPAPDMVARMATDGGVEDPARDPASNPKVVMIRGLVNDDATDGWEKCWEEGLTPWDLGQATPAVLQLVKTGVEHFSEALVLLEYPNAYKPDKDIRVEHFSEALVLLEYPNAYKPDKDIRNLEILCANCGSIYANVPDHSSLQNEAPDGGGYDVVAIAGPERYVVGLDISTSAVEKAKELSSSLPNANQFTFVAADFFAWQPTEKFDLIFDYTFFCAIDPCLRPAWAQKIQEILKPDGELITLIYLISGQEGGPPYNTTVADYEQVLNPVGFKALSIEDNELAVKPRKFGAQVGRMNPSHAVTCNYF
ncbi:Thiopurine S-methyltransferase (TPMT) [Musa troglodytarum]|uniref:Thiopurine S-methyltransferase (TPMT) n=1 Tax=Musa troglodytarum TaxID=320322 RepID=A0A9E7L6X9_9LILI|nr:Thiopurine S-methyltransferase (TPMT) [Musa troglodytarum]